MTNGSTFRLSLLSATILGGTALALPAAAQSTGASDPTRQEPAGTQIAAADDNAIIVTATRRATTLLDTPINITALSGDTLAQQRVDDVRDIADFTPGLTIPDTGPRSTGSIVLRGLNAGDTSDTGSGYDNALGIYLGEVPLYYDFKLLDIDRVEVLLGPQGTLYGLGTLAGAIRYIPKLPDADEFQAEVHGRVYAKAHSEDAGVQADAVINIPIVTDHVAFRSVNGYYFDPGFIDYPLLLQTPGVSIAQPGGPDGFFTDEAYAANLRRENDLNYERTYTSRNQLLLQTGPNFRAIVTYAYQQTETEGVQANHAGVLNTGRYESAARYTEPAERHAHLAALELNISVGDIFDIVSSTGYTEVKTEAQGDVTDLLLDLDYDYEAFPAFSGFNYNRTKREQVNQEVRFVSTHGGPLSWVIGGFYNEQKLDSYGFESTPGLSDFYGVPNNPDDLEYISYIRSKIEEKAVFGEATLNITDEWQVTGGLRYFDYTSEITGALSLPLLGDPTDVYSQEPAGGVGGEDGVVWKFNTSYRFAPDFMAYATYSKGYRIGGPNRVAPCPDPVPEDQQNACALPNEQQYGPDTTKNLEIGIRAGLFDRRLNISANVFNIDWEGIQVASATFYGVTGITVNGGKARSRGFEATFNAQPIPPLSIAGSYSFTDAELRSDVPDLIAVRTIPGYYGPYRSRTRPDLPTKFSQLDALKGDRLPGSARHTASLGATYTHDLNDDAELIANWTATYRGEVVTRLGGARTSGEVLPDYLTHRASLTYATDRFDLTLWANNIFDKYAVTSIGNDLSRVGVNDGQAVRFYSRAVLNPRTVGLEARIRM
ncbi:TonB-dependent receptor [Croceibacterium sp. TMG7-5b_MA50]|uniref:TonB-dependent receptor n=1 Tax=Croceibacterium sp. TMG7-5b_MA50 TaxID=3121290 RepID=UPI003221F966